MKDSGETIFVAAGEKIEIFSRRFSSIPMNYEFVAKAVRSVPLSGQLEVQSKKILFTASTQVKDLKFINTFKTSLWDTFMNVYVVADCDVEITVPKRVLKSSKQSLLISAFIILIASAVMIAISTQ